MDTALGANCVEQASGRRASKVEHSEGRLFLPHAAGEKYAFGQEASVKARLAVLLSRVPSPIAKRFTTDSWLTKIARPLIEAFAPSEPSEIAIRSGEGKGLKLFIDLRHEKYYLTGTWELPVQEALTAELSPSAPFWDVGAHCGFFTVIAASRGARVHAFEPMPENRHRLERAIAANALERVTVHPYAIGLASGQAILRASDSTSEWSLLGEGEGVTVGVRTLDEMLDVLGPPHVVKIDVEGAEVDVLRGAKRLLTDPAPTLLVEFTSPRHVDEARELVPDYSFSALSDNQWLLRRKPHPSG